jgi:2-phosphosulfolactate phosphatase
LQIHYADLSNCHLATGVVVVIDVLRAFTSAAFALNAGAREIFLVGTVEEALDLRRRFPGARAMGEVGGLKVPGFDYSNSPHEVSRADLRGRTLIQRTSAGTQGVVRSTRAETLYAASFPVAGATAAILRRLSPPSVTFVITEIDPQVKPEDRPPRQGDEDTACADYLAALLLQPAGQFVDPAPFLQRVLDSASGQKLAQSNRSDFSAQDLGYATALDRCPFGLSIRRDDGLLRMSAADPLSTP